MKKIINKVKDFLGFNAPVTYLYIENGVYLRDYSDFIEGTTDMYYERLEEYKQKRNLINN